jgi:predicted kinase
MVIIVFGLPGSGKSYFASRLAADLKALYVSTDELRLKLIPKRKYTDAEKALVYDSVEAMMADALRDKKPIVLDGTFYKESLRKKFEHTAGKFNEKIIYIEVTAPEGIIEDRLKQPRQYSEADYAVYLLLKKQFEPLLQDHLVLISSNNTISSMLRKAVRYIKTFK